MSELKYKRVPTTYEVYSTIVNEHTKKQPYELCVFESYTNIVEDGVCTIYTVWGLSTAEVALVGAETKYGTEDEKEIEGTRTNEYWLCAAYLEDEE